MTDGLTQTKLTQEAQLSLARITDRTGCQ